MKNEKYDICLDCDEERYMDTETSELVCQSCGKVERLTGIAFDETQFFNQEGQTRQPIPTKNSATYFRQILEKFKILDAVNITISNGREVYNPAWYRFLGDVIDNFGNGGKSVNYACFLHDYFQAVSSDVWSQKEEILGLHTPHLPKISKTHWLAKARFHKWWEDTILR